MFKTPLKNLFISAPLLNPLPDAWISHSQKTAASSIKTDPEIFVIIAGKLAGRHQPDFIEHPGEINDATHLVIGAARELCHAEG